MKITGVELKNFKRFSNLTIDSIPETSKLVLLIGANGSGKSSVFDAFDWLSKGIFKGLPSDSVGYYRKDLSMPSIVGITFSDGIKIRKEENTVYGPKELIKKFFGRSSIRIVPRITNQSNVDAVSGDSDSPYSYIDNDTRFLNDISLYINQIDFALREPVFKGEQVNVLKIFQDSISPLNDSLINIFGGNDLTQIRIAEFENATPNKNAKLIFSKGGSKINYDLLSHGEKQVIILLLNFIVRKKYYDNSIIFIDEMDCHLNTSLQYRLLEEIVTKWIPESSQLWTASHALGFIDYAKKSDHASIIDFDLMNFDTLLELVPQSKEALDVYEIAIPRHLLVQMMKGKRIYFCENQNDEFYNLAQIRDSLFVGLRDSREVFLNVKRDSNSHSLRDRDFLTDNEINKLKQRYPGHHILHYYNFENYLYHPDNILEINPQGFDRDKYINDLINQKNTKYESIIVDIKPSRNNYEEFKTDSIKDDSIDQILNDLRSDDLERFYKFFDMKNKFTKKFLGPYNLSRSSLCQTTWFKDRIQKIIA